GGCTGFVSLRGADTTTWTGREIGASGVGLQQAIAFDDDRVDRLRNSGARRGNCHEASADKDTAEDQAANSQSPNHPHTKSHSLRALLIHAAAPTADSTDGPACLGQLFTAFSPPF